MSARRRVWRVRLTRDLATFGLGLAILGHQAFWAAAVHPELVAGAVALLLAPAAARVDDAVKDRRRSDREETERDGASR